MKSRGEGIVGYHVQTAVDVDSHLIVVHDVTNIGIDRRQLSPMASKVKAVLDREEPIKVIADQRYYRGEELLAYNMKRVIDLVGVRRLMEAI